MKEFDLGMETIYMVINGQVQEIAQEDRFHNAYFTKGVVEDGIRDCHITVVSGLSREEKINAVQTYIDMSNAPRTQITNL